MALSKTNETSENSGNEHRLIDAKDLCFSLRTVKSEGGRNTPSLSRLMLHSLRSRATIHERQILDNLNFSLSSGDRVGLIGSNGAGKSTLLFVLNGALQISSGKLDIHGKTHALMNVRLGMKVRATGVENIYLNGYRLGFKSSQIRELIDDIVEFSELGEKINEPVYTYSAGMQLRLAFAIATSIKPDILLMDEWVGAGDRRFRTKAADRLNKVVAQSRALVIASHNEALIRSVCNKVMVLDGGKMVFFGGIDEGYELFNENSDK